MSRDALSILIDWSKRCYSVVTVYGRLLLGLLVVARVQVSASLLLNYKTFQRIKRFFNSIVDKRFLQFDFLR